MVAVSGLRSTLEAPRSNLPSAGGSRAADQETPVADKRVDLALLRRGRRRQMLAAGREVLECRRVLEKADLNIVGEVLRGHGTFYELEHYPREDVYDRHSHSQYYYHAHRGPSGEHGHFHTFLRGPGMPRGVRPVPYSGREKWPAGNEAMAHLVAISMDAFGWPIGLFTVNRWVTAEAFYPAEAVIKMLDCYVIDHAYPSWPVNRWMSAMMILFRPQIKALIRARDAAVSAWASSHPGVDVYEDRGLEVTSALTVTVEEQIERLRAALK